MPSKLKQKLWLLKNSQYFAKVGVVMNEVFLAQIYLWLYKRIKPGTLVIDIGGYMGESAVYFAMHPNTREVWTYEPDRNSYKIMFENLRSKQFRISAYNRAIKDGKDLNKVLGRAKGPVAIKCDCEGCEYDIFDNVADLGKVYAIQMEYHHGIQQLAASLEEKGFKVSHTKPKAYEDYMIGYLYAHR